MKKQLSIFIGIFLFLAIGMHFKEWISHPIDHIMALPHAGAYGLGMIHPLVFTLGAYLLFIFLLFIGNMLKKLFSK